MAALAMAVITGCGGSSSSSSSTASTTEASTKENSGAAPEPSGSTYVIGGLTPVSGEGYDFPDWLAGGKAAVDAINASGGINGHPVEYFNCDDKNNPNEATACARKMVEKKVIAVAGGGSLFAENIATILEEAEIPWVGGYPETKAQYNGENEFLLDSGVFMNGAGSAVAFNKAGAKSVGEAHFELPQSAPSYEAFESAAKTLGMNLTESVSFPANATDMSPYVQKMINQGPEGVQVFAIPNLAVAFMKAANQLGAKFKYAWADGYLTPSEYESVGEYEVDVVGGLPPVTAGEEDPSKFPGMVEFTEDVEALQKSGEKYAEKQYVGYGMLRTWLAAKVVAQIAETLKGEVNAPAMLKALNSAKNIETGVIPPWTPGANEGPTGYRRISNPNIYISEVGSDGFPHLTSPEPLNVLEEAQIK
ncbi:MAG TPA: ABC transporter substrate-binding protein [Solirubrobacterales bacterium]